MAGELVAQYLLTAKNPAGRTVSELIEADSAKSAIGALQERGCENIVLHTDDATARDSRPLPLWPYSASDNVSRSLGSEPGKLAIIPTKVGGI